MRTSRLILATILAGCGVYGLAIVARLLVTLNTMVSGG